MISSTSTEHVQVQQVGVWYSIGTVQQARRDCGVGADMTSLHILEDCGHNVHLDQPRNLVGICSACALIHNAVA